MGKVQKAQGPGPRPFKGNKKQPVANEQKKNADTPMKKGGRIEKKNARGEKFTKVKETKVLLGLGQDKLGEAELERRREQNLRSLFIKFTSKKLPTSTEEVKALHPDIKHVRAPRADKENKGAFNYAFLEFTNEEECVKAREKLMMTRYGDSELLVDFMGAKSKKGAAKEETQARFNLRRLFISGLVPGITKTALRQMFPKCSSADIPKKSRKKGSQYAFVQFSRIEDAKAAFDAAQDIDIEGHKITVLYATISEEKDKMIEKKKEKRQKEIEKKKELKRQRKQEALEAKQKLLESDEPKAKKKKKNTKEVKEKKEETREASDDEQNDDESDEEKDGEEDDYVEAGNEEANGNDDDNEEDDDEDDDENDADDDDAKAGNDDANANNDDEDDDDDQDDDDNDEDDDDEDDDK